MLNSKSCRIQAMGIFGILAVIVLLTFRDYGVTWDEELQSLYGNAVADYYATFFKDQRYQQIFNLYLYGGMFDGVAAVLEHYVPLHIYDTRHLLNAIFGLLGLWGTWKLGRFLGGEGVALGALVLCAATPSYYGHMFNNPKDIPYAAGIVWTLYHMSRAYVKPTWGTIVKLCIVYGLTLGVRVGGAMVFAFWLAPMGLIALLPLLKYRDFVGLRKSVGNVWRDFWHLVAPVGILSYAIMLVCWPWAQQHPIANPLRALSEFSNFPQDVEVLLDGVTYRSTNLPWDYVPLYFGIQLPELLLGLLAVAVAFSYRIFRNFTMAQKQSFFLILVTAGVPIMYAVLRHPALYDTVRHFLFVIPLACIIAALGARELFNFISERFCHPKARPILLASFFAASLIFVVSQVVAMVRLHPYEYIYANSFVGGVRGAFGRYESDYWGASFKDAAEDLDAFVVKQGGVPPGKIWKVAICGPWSSASIYLPPNFKPVVANEPAQFFISTTRWMCQNMRPGKEVIRIERMGAPLAIVKDLRNGFVYYEGNKTHWNERPVLP